MPPSMYSQRFIKAMVKMLGKNQSSVQKMTAESVQIQIEI